MIKQLKIQNFKCFKDICVDFHAGLNTITGESYEGKSSIIKAIIWAEQNNPRGFNFKSHFSSDKDETIVEIITDKDRIKRLRSKSKNCYILNNDEKHPFEALNSNVPDEIKNKLNVSDINIHNQFDKFFLIQETAGEVGRQLNELVGLQIIDRTQKNIDQMSRENNSDIRQNKKQIEEKKQKLENLRWVDDAELHIKKTDKIIIKRNDVEEKINTLSETILKIKKIIDKIKQQDIIVLLDKNVEIIIDSSKKTKEYDKKIERIDYLIDKIKIEKSKKFTIIGFENDINKIIQSRDGSQNINNSVLKINNIINNIDVTKKIILKQEFEINKLQEQFNHELAINKICPLCKGKIK